MTSHCHRYGPSSIGRRYTSIVRRRHHVYTYVSYTIYCDTDRFAHINYDDDDDNNNNKRTDRIVYRYCFFFFFFETIAARAPIQTGHVLRSPGPPSGSRIGRDSAVLGGDPRRCVPAESWCGGGGCGASSVYARGDDERLAVTAASVIEKTRRRAGTDCSG